MKLKVYNGKGPEEKKWPMVMLESDGCISATDESGNRIVYIAKCNGEGYKSCEGCREILRGKGYDTSFAKWDNRGRFLEWL